MTKTPSSKPESGLSPLTDMDNTLRQLQRSEARTSQTSSHVDNLSESVASVYYAGAPKPGPSGSGQRYHRPLTTLRKAKVTQFMAEFNANPSVFEPYQSEAWISQLIVFLKEKKNQTPSVNDVKRWIDENPDLFETVKLTVSSSAETSPEMPVLSPSSPDITSLGHERASNDVEMVAADENQNVSQILKTEDQTAAQTDDKMKVNLFQTDPGQASDVEMNSADDYEKEQNEDNLGAQLVAEDQSKDDKMEESKTEEATPAQQTDPLSVNAPPPGPSGQRYHRPLTALRKAKVTQFMAEFNANPSAFEPFRSEAWFSQLIAFLKEKKNQTPSVNDVKRWIDENPDLFETVKMTVSSSAETSPDVKSPGHVRVINDLEMVAADENQIVSQILKTEDQTAAQTDDKMNVKLFQTDPGQASDVEMNSADDYEKEQNEDNLGAQLVAPIPIAVEDNDNAAAPTVTENGYSGDDEIEADKTEEAVPAPPYPIAVQNQTETHRMSRNYRQFTAPRKSKVIQFMAAFNENPENYEPFPSDGWIRQLISFLNEKKHKKPVVKDVRKWIDDAPEVFKITQVAPPALAETSNEPIASSSKVDPFPFIAPRYHRPLTPARTRKVTQFIAEFNANPRAYAEFQSDAWIDQLITFLNEKKHQKASIEDVKKWMASFPELFQADPGQASDVEMNSADDYEKEQNEDLGAQLVTEDIQSNDKMEIDKTEEATPTQIDPEPMSVADNNPTKVETVEAPTNDDKNKENKPEEAAPSPKDLLQPGQSPVVATPVVELRRFEAPCFYEFMDAHNGWNSPLNYWTSSDQAEALKLLDQHTDSI